MDVFAASHGLAALVASALTAHLAIGWRGGRVGAWLVGLMVLNTLWATLSMAWSLTGHLALLYFATLFEVAREGAALALIITLLGGAKRMWVLAALALVLTFFAGSVLLLSPPGLASARLQAQAMLALSVIGLSAVEQLWRNTPPTSSRGIKPLCLALAALFGFDLYIHAEAALFGMPAQDTWAIRGFVVTLCLPLLWLFGARNPDARLAVTLSRRLVFHSAALAACGSYLLLMSAAGFYVRDFGGRWGPALQALLLFTGALLFVALATSGALRAALRISVAKHFFTLRYDYRETWLKLTATLAQAKSFNDAAARITQALADLVESPAGALWWRDEHGDFHPAAHHDLGPLNACEPHTNPALQSLINCPGVIDLATPGQAPQLEVLHALPNARLIVPLNRHGVLQGFVILMPPRIPLDINWEVRDALKTAAAQAVSDLSHWHNFDALLTARKFETANSLATFTLHDLKNCVAELSLLLSNAKRHGANPQFQQDMLTTIEHVVSKMRALMNAMQQGVHESKVGEVDVASILENLIGKMALQQPAPRLHIERSASVQADATRLTRVIGHLLQNAIDATDANGGVWVNLGLKGNHAVIEIHDTGQGMSEEFVRDRLFKPFQTTKSAGMGIGAFETQQYIRALGGRIDVTSTPGQGTSMAVRLPLAASPPRSLSA